jgi:hypothetical protein
MTQILEALAAGRIDPAEAARRIDAISSTHAENATPDPASSSSPSDARSPISPLSPTGPQSPAGPASSETVEPDANRSEASPVDAGADRGQVDSNAWAASTDRPQRPAYPTEAVGRTATPTESAAEPSTAQAGSNNAKSGRSPWRPKFPRRQQNANGVEKLSIRAVGRRVRIVGEPSVATVSADGPHVLRRNGSVLEISSDGEFGASIDGFQLLKATRSLDDFRSLGLGKELLLRVNPSLLVDVEVTGGSLNTEGVPRLGSVRVTAGGAKLLDVAEIADALVQAGQATVKGAITSGRSRVRVESGSLSLQLADSSNVTVSTETQLGKISWGGAHAGFSGDEVVLGTGSAKLDVEVVMGHASIKAGTTNAGKADSGNPASDDSGAA